MDTEPTNDLKNAVSEENNITALGSIDSTHLLSSPKHSRKKAVFAVLICSIVIGGIVGAIILSNNTSGKSQESEKTTQKSDTEESASSNQNTYVQQSPEALTIFYDGKVGDSEVKDNPDAYLTVAHPKEWPVYRRVWNHETGTFSSLYIQAPNNKYLHISWVEGVGGDCLSNSETYILVKKLPTQDSLLYFTQYSDSAKSMFSLEGFGARRSFLGDVSATDIAKHESLKEGQSSTNTCALSFYPYAVGKVMVAVKNSSDPGFKSNLLWSDIKDDTAFIAMLQSLKTYQK